MWVYEVRRQAGNVLRDNQPMKRVDETDMVLLFVLNILQQVPITSVISICKGDLDYYKISSHLPPGHLFHVHCSSLRLSDRAITLLSSRRPVVHEKKIMMHLMNCI